MVYRILKLVSIATIGLISPAVADGLGNEGTSRLLRDAQSLQSLTDRVFTVSPPKHISVNKTLPYLNTIEAASVRYHIPKQLIAAVIKCESNWNPGAKSKKGAIGLMQVLPTTAEGLFKGTALLLWDPKVNIHVGTAYLRVLANRYAGEAGKVVAGYNVGPTWVSSGRKLPNETRLYRRCVSRWVQHYAKRL
jgi:soluble lytic murein transglycosylase-like protein